MYFFVMNGRLANVTATTNQQRLCDNFQPGVHTDVISGLVVDPMGAKVHVNVGDSRSNRSRDILLPHFVTNANDNENDGRWTV